MVPPEVAAQVATTMEKPVLSGRSSNFGTQRTPFFRHDFTGANAAIPRLLGHSRHAGDAAARLQIAATVEVDFRGTPVAGGVGEVEVRVKNLRAGHNLPTSMTELRQMWLHVQVSDGGREGAVVWESGALDAAGNLDPQAKTFGARAVDGDGNPTWKPWQIHRIAEDTSIPPRGEATELYRFAVPVATRGPLRVRAVLRYRSFPQTVADRYLDVAGYRVPTIDMAEGERVAPVESP